MRQLFQLWILSVSVIVASNADALLLGDIQVNSHLAQPLNAQIAFVDISDVDVQQLKIRLAGVEEYKKLGLQYPENTRFVFQVAQEPGALLPFIRILTSRPIDEPFVNLLLEINQASGKLIKAYTFLLDPAGELIPSDEPVVQQIAQDAVQHAGPKSGMVQGEAVKTASKRNRRHAGHRTQNKKIVQPAVQADGSTHMKLAMSLSISRYDPSLPLSPKEASDALQEELIAKEKSLAELKSQVGEMQGVIKSLQSKLEPSDLPASAVPVAAKAEKTANLPLPVPAKSAEVNWLNPLLGLIVLLLGGAAFIWYRKYRQIHAWQHGAFEDAGEEMSGTEESQPFLSKEPQASLVQEAQLKAPVSREPLWQPEAPQIKSPQLKEPLLVKSIEPLLLTENDSVAPATAASSSQAEMPSMFDKMASSFGERSMETPAYAEQASTPTVPPEYAILMEANRYMRSGNEKLAEDALIRAIGVNPKNAYGYLALLKIYGTRNDKASFEYIAGKLKDAGDDAAFEEAAEMGRKLDPDNLLYA